MTGGLAATRLSQERKAWRKNHPIGFFARPQSKGDGSTDMMVWDCGIPGKKGTDWENGVYKVQLKFHGEYPAKPPECKFVPAIFHPNVFKSGHICLSLLKEGKGWRPAISVKEILVGIQDLLDDPNASDPAQTEANDLYIKDKAKYSQKIREQAKKYEAEF